MALGLTLGLIGIATFGLRLVFIGRDYGRIPAALQQALRYVPVAVLTAIIVPNVLRASDQAQFVYNHPRVWAALVAVIIAWRTRNVLLTIGLGMATLWLLQALFG